MIVSEKNLTPDANGKNPIRLWLVDDSRSFRCLLADFLDDEGDFECVAQFSSAEAMLEALKHETAPDVILLDVNMGGISGLEAIRPIKAIASSTRVLMLTALSDRDGKTQALRDGASDFLLKSYPLTIPGHIRLALATPVAAEANRAADGGEIFTANSSLPNRRASEPTGRAPDGATRLLPVQGCREAVRRCTPSRLVRGVRFLRTLFKWGGRAEPADVAQVFQPASSRVFQPGIPAGD